MNIRGILLSTAFLVSFNGCGGGGGGDSFYNACGAIRVLNGEVCETGNSALVRVFNGRSLCTGTVISPDRVLTAAHCFNGRSFRGVEIIASNGDTTFSVDAFVPNLWLRSGSTEADAGIVRIDRNFVTRNQIEPIKAFRNGADVDFIGSEIVVAGYGNRGSNQENVSPFPVSTFMEVTTASGGTFTASDTASERTGNACRGDSGAPALQRGIDGDTFVVGIVSRGVISGDCETDPFTVFADVANSEVASLIASETEGDL